MAEFEVEETNETEVEREIRIEDGVATIDSDLVQTVDIEQFMEMFENKVAKQRKLNRKVRDMQNSIEQLLEDRADDMQNLHAIDSTQDQNQLTEEISRGNAVNSLPFAAIQTYVQLRQAKDELEQNRQKLEDLEEDLADLGPAAEEVAEEYDSLDIPEIWGQKVKEEVGA